MADISAMIAEKNAQDEERQRLNKAERANLSAMRDAALTEVTSDPEQFARYLDLQAANIRCCSGNVALTMLQMADRAPTLIGSADFWHGLGRSVMATELSKGARVFVRPRNSRYNGYLLGQYYDVSQTTGRPVAATPELEEGSPRMEMALATLMNCSPVRVKEDRDLEAAAIYDPANMELSVNTDRQDMEIFVALAVEIAYARLHDRGYNAAFDREGCRVEAEAIGYLTCRRFGVDAPQPDIQSALGTFNGLDASLRGQMLEQIRTRARELGDGVARVIQPRLPERSSRDNTAR